MFFLQYKTPHTLELKALAVFFSAFVHVAINTLSSKLNKEMNDKMVMTLKILSINLLHGYHLMTYRPCCPFSSALQ